DETRFQTPPGGRGARGPGPDAVGCASGRNGGGRRRGPRRATGEAMVRLVPRRRLRPDAWSGQRARLRHHRQNVWVQRGQDHAVSYGRPPQDAGHAARTRRSQGPRRLYRKPGAIGGPSAVRRPVLVGEAPLAVDEGGSEVVVR